MLISIYKSVIRQYFNELRHIWNRLSSSDEDFYYAVSSCIDSS